MRSTVCDNHPEHLVHNVELDCSRNARLIGPKRSFRSTTEYYIGVLDDFVEGIDESDQCGPAGCIDRSTIWT